MYTLYTDGACSGNPGPGGYAYIITTPPDRVIKKSGGYSRTTNNRMELQAVAEGLSQIPTLSRVEIVTDSEYVVHAFTKKWIDGWIARGWKNSQKKPVANRDLWERLLELSRDRTLTFTWVRGHDGHRYNELCDLMAVEACSQPALMPDEGYEKLHTSAA